MFKTIVWASDGSKNAQAALERAKDLASESGGRLIAVYVRQLFIGRGGGLPARYDDAEVQADLRRIVSELRHDGYDASLEVVRTTRSNPARSIASVATDARADLIVLGSRGHSPTASFLLGSVGQRLMKLASCSVMSVRSSTIERETRQAVERSLAA
jgi:nucleotide-binding universal stress UspA family protein